MDFLCILVKTKYTQNFEGLFVKGMRVSKKQ